MMDRRGRWLGELADRVSDAGGALAAGVRRDLVSGKALAGDLGELAERIAAGGLGVTDEHIQHLLAAGYDEDAVFECVVAAAVGAGLQRLRAVERLLQDR